MLSPFRNKFKEKNENDLDKKKISKNELVNELNLPILEQPICLKKAKLVNISNGRSTSSNRCLEEKKEVWIYLRKLQRKATM